MLEETASCLTVKQPKFTKFTLTKSKRKFVEFAEFGNLFYGGVVFLLHLVSISVTIIQTRRLMRAFMLDLSERLVHSINNHTGTHVTNGAKFFVLKQFALQITFLSISTCALFLFCLCCLFKTGNLANDDVALGRDLVLIEESAQSDFNSTINISILSSQTSNISSNLHKPLTFSSTKSSNLMKCFYLPAFNSSAHLLMCFALLISRLELTRLQLSNDLSNNTLFEQPTLNVYSASRFSLILIWLCHFINKFQSDLNYSNFMFAFFILAFKFTRLYLKMNPVYAVLIFAHLILLSCLSFATFPALEALLKSNPGSLSEKVNSLDEFKGLLEIKKANLTENVSNFVKLMPDWFSNETLVLGSFALGWTLNLFYLSSLNVFAVSFYREALSRLTLKYSHYLKTPEKSEDLRCETRNLLSSNKQLEQRVAAQYKSIIVGIFTLLGTEAARLPFIYACYLKYSLHNKEIYLTALMAQLVYLLFNALFWIVFSFKQRWNVKFEFEFRLLLWNYLYEENVRKLNLNESSKLTTICEALKSSKKKFDEQMFSVYRDLTSVSTCSSSEESTRKISSRLDSKRFSSSDEYCVYSVPKQAYRDKLQTSESKMPSFNNGKYEPAYSRDFLLGEINNSDSWKILNSQQPQLRFSSFY